MSKGISVKFDDRDTFKPGWKFNEYELKGVPVRIAMGPRDLEKNQIEVALRDTGDKNFISLEKSVEHILSLLQEIDENIYQKAKDNKQELTTKVDTWDDFQNVIENKGGFVSAHWDGTTETEEKIQELTKATIRCIPLDAEKEEGKCIFTGKPSQQRVLFAKAY